MLLAMNEDAQPAQPHRHPVLMPQATAVDLVHTHQEQIQAEPAAPPRNVILLARDAFVAALRRRQQRKPPMIWVRRRPTRHRFPILPQA
jgi:hypothetical protein